MHLGAPFRGGVSLGRCASKKNCSHVNSQLLVAYRQVGAIRDAYKGRKAWNPNGPYLGKHWL